MLVSTMMNYKEVPFEGIKDEFQIDLEAMTTPDIEEYKSQFHKFLS